MNPDLPLNISRKEPMSNPSAHPHGEMRRKEREITDPAELESILQTGNLMRIALVDGDMPFLVPVHYAFHGQAIYFHSAQAGTKMEILTRNNHVCFEVSLDHGVIESESACDFEARHRTVIGIGQAFPVEEEAEKISALDSIVAKFTTRHLDYPKEILAKTAVTRIDIASMKGKKHGL